MENLYEWFYDTYADPKLKEQPLFREELLEPLLRPLTEDQRIDCLDLLNTLRLHWCTAAFQLGCVPGWSSPANSFSCESMVKTVPFSNGYWIMNNDGVLLRRTD